MPRAIQIQQFGGPEVLQLVDLPVVNPAPARFACGTTRWA